MGLQGELKLIEFVIASHVIYFFTDPSKMSRRSLTRTVLRIGIHNANSALFVSQMRVAAS